MLWTETKTAAYISYIFSDIITIHIGCTAGWWKEPYQLHVHNISVIYLLHTMYLHNDTYLIPGPSWSWSYGSWIYNYLCNQCLSPLIEPRSGEVYSIQNYGIKFVSKLWQVGGFLQVLWFTPPIKMTTTI